MPKLDELEAAHRAIGGIGVGRRTATQQINDAYVVLLAAQFQKFCRDLHTEAATALAAGAPQNLQPLVQLNLTRARQLDRANAQPGSIGADFGNLLLRIWDELAVLDRRTAISRQYLEQLNVWRNAVAHQDFVLTPEQQQLVQGTKRSLDWIRRWRVACDRLAETMDRALDIHLRCLTGHNPW